MAEIEKNIESYIKDRLDQYINWYDKKSVTMKKKYLQGRTCAALGAVIVPIFTNVALPIIHITPNYTVDTAKAAVTIISTIVALLIALEGVFHYSEQWKNYRTTELYLTAQKNLFLNNVGDFANLSKEDGFKLLVKKVETAITEENAITLNVLTKIDNGNSKIMS